MGLFGKSPEKTENPINELIKRIFPNGKPDIDEGTDELLRILNNSISREIARNIFVKSFARSTMDSNFDINELRIHLDGYCNGVFSAVEMQQLLDYLTARKIGMVLGGHKVHKDKNGNYVIN